MQRLLTLILTLALIGYSGYSQEEKQYKVACIGFYNVENLFDTIDQEDVRDEEFTPAGSNNWSGERYKEKLDRLSDVLGQVATDLSPDGLAIVGLSEIENRSVIEDLIETPELKERDYGIVHYDSPDRRGVDVGLIYQKKYFRVTNSESYHLTIEDKPDFLSRDQLLVSGYLDDELIHIIVNHWPSRRGGEQRSRPLRNAAADLNRHIIDSLLQLDPDAKVMVMGDLNDDPVDPSVRKHLKAVGHASMVNSYRMFNPMEELYRQGIGTLAYRDKWNLFDQIIISPAFLPKSQPGWFFHKARVFNKEFLRQKTGNFKGYPYRSYAGGVYLGGYSDHFPVYVILAKPI